MIIFNPTASGTDQKVDHQGYVIDFQALVLLLNQQLAPINARATKAAVQVIPTGAFTVLTYDTNTYDTSGVHSTTVNPSRFTVPEGCGGLYMAVANVNWSPNAAGQRHVVALMNGAVWFGSVFGNAVPVAGANTMQVLTAVYQMVPGDYVEYMVFQDTGANLNLANNGIVGYGSLTRIST